MVQYKLEISLVPNALWGENLRKRLTRSSWNKLRAIQFEKVPHCEYCRSSPTGAERHAHEDWVYDIESATARLRGLRTICRMCHFVEHLGFVGEMVRMGRFTKDIFRKVEQHFCRVNGCKPGDYRRHRDEAGIRYGELTRIEAWTIDYGPYAHLVEKYFVLT
jgi:hypothetical protein